MEKPSVLRERICKECGKIFIGGPRAWYCPECRSDRTKKHNREFKARKRAGAVIPVGSKIVCPDCGCEFIKMGGLHERCPDCAKKHLKLVDNSQSLDWVKNNPEKNKANKRVFAKRRNSGPGKQSGVKGIYWKKDSDLWIIRYYDKREKAQIYLGRFKNLDDAISALDKYKSENGLN